MNISKSIKNIFNNHTILFVIVAAIALLYFIDNYSKRKGKGLEGIVSTSMAASGFSEEGGNFPMDAPGVNNKAGSANCCQDTGGNYVASSPLGQNEANAVVNGIQTSNHGLAPSCTRKEIADPSQLLPKDNNGQFSQMNPMGAGEVKDVSLLRAGYHIGINTVGQSMRNANLQLRSEPANPQLDTGPWNTTTIGPDFNRRPLEIGCGPF
jgi:hypothetical protein